MYKRVILIPYKMGSAVCKALKETLIANGMNCIRRLSSSLRPIKKTDLLVYYGGVDILPNEPGNSINIHRNVAQNKLYALQRLTQEGLSTVPWTTNAEEAQQWPTIVARATLTGHSGQGITIHEQWQPLPIVPLYTKYIKKTFECRIHIFNGSVIDAQIKRKKVGTDDGNPHIRNVHTGWVYCRDGYTPDDPVKTLAISAVNTLDLEFGAVDLIYNQHYKQYYILEVNTAPGLTGTTLINYMEAIKNVYNS